MDHKTVGSYPRIPHRHPSLALALATKYRTTISLPGVGRAGGEDPAGGSPDQSPVISGGLHGNGTLRHASSNPSQPASVVRVSAHSICPVDGPLLMSDCMMFTVASLRRLHICPRLMSLGLTRSRPIALGLGPRLAHMKSKKS